MLARVQAFVEVSDAFSCHRCLLRFRLDGATFQFGFALSDLRQSQPLGEKANIEMAARREGKRGEHCVDGTNVKRDQHLRAVVWGEQRR